MALTPNADLTAALRARIARVAVGPSTVRHCPAGTAEAARRFLRHVDLSRFAAGDGEQFRTELDLVTSDLQAVLPGDARQWGLARKILNMFLRDCVYNAHLRAAYALGRGERHCEVPLDSTVVRRLAASESGRALPAWPGISGLGPDVSDEYQAVAARVAALLRVRRVHLDAFWWSGPHDADQHTPGTSRRN